MVPGSHRWGRDPSEVIGRQSYPNEVRLLGPAGTVAFFNGHIWHGASLNKSTEPRWSLNSFWRKRESPMENGSRIRCILKDRKRLSQAAQHLLL